MPAEFKQIPFAEYLKAPGLSSSFLRNMSRSPAHAKHLAETDRDSAALQIGRALHCAVLEPSCYGERLKVGPECDRRTKQGKADWAAFEASCSPDCEMLDSHEDLAVRGMSAALLNHGLAGQLLKHPRMKAEQSLFWTTKGVACKARLDCLTEFYGEPIVLDVKTTMNAAEFERSIIKYGYHIQCAWYMRGLAAANFTPIRFLFVAVESMAPHGVCVYELSQEFLDVANQEINSNFERYVECVKANHWPAYQEDIRSVACPAWMGDGILEAGE